MMGFLYSSLQAGYSRDAFSDVVVAVKAVPFLVLRYPSRKSAAESTYL